jgi:hypothetical protein
MEDDFDALFAEARYRDIDDVIAGRTDAKRKRGRENVDHMRRSDKIRKKIDVKYP